MYFENCQTYISDNRQKVITLGSIKGKRKGVHVLVFFVRPGHSHFFLPPCCHDLGALGFVILILKIKNYFYITILLHIWCVFGETCVVVIDGGGRRRNQIGSSIHKLVVSSNAMVLKHDMYQNVLKGLLKQSAGTHPKVLGSAGLGLGWRI